MFILIRPRISLLKVWEYISTKWLVEPDKNRICKVKILPFWWMLLWNINSTLQLINLNIKANPLMSNSNRIIENLWRMKCLFSLKHMNMIKDGNMFCKQQKLLLRNTLKWMMLIREKSLLTELTENWLFWQINNHKIYHFLQN
jgi:hypothetical protein